MAGERFRAGQAHGGVLAVVDGHRKGRAVCLILPDRERPGGPARVLEMILERLNAEHERLQARRNTNAGGGA